jgi:membrane protein DedA with SNARE-associated domain
VTAQQGLTRNATNAIVTGRLIPGGRTPVIVALGLSRFPVRRFMLIDTLACALWAGIYSTLGSIGGRVTNHPVWAMVVAIAFAVSVGVLVQQVIKLGHWYRARGDAAPAGPPSSAGSTALDPEDVPADRS